MSDIYLQGLWFLAMQHILGIIIPGPCMAIVIKYSIESRKKGLETVFGSILGSFVVKSLAILSLAIILVEIPAIFNFMQILGASYILFLGIAALKSAFQDWRYFNNPTQIRPIAKSLSKKLSSPFITGFLINFSSPFNSIGFIAIFATAISPDMPLILQLSYLVILAFISLIMYVGIVLFFSTGKMQQILEHYKFILNLILGATMFYWSYKIFQVDL